MTAAAARIVSAVALVLAWCCAAPARGEDNSVLRGLYGYWRCESNPASNKQVFDDGTLQHPAEYECPSNGDKGKDLPPERVAGMLGDGLLFRGPAQPSVMLVPYPKVSPRHVTVSLWAWMDERRDDATLFSNTAIRNNGYGEFRFNVVKDGIAVTFGEFNPRVPQGFRGPHEVMSTHVTFPPHAWQHVALVIDEPTARLYLNGAEIGRITLAQPLEVRVVQKVAFGAYRGRAHDDVENDPLYRDNFGAWAGRIDEVAMWDRAMSAAEIRGVRAATLAGRPVYDAVPNPSMTETDSFRIATLAGLATGLTLLLHRIVTRRLRGRLSLAEGRLSLDRERQRIADDIHDELGARLARVSLLSELAAGGGAKAPKHLAGVTTAAQDASRSLDELVWALKPSQDSLANLAAYLSNYASEFLGDTGIALRLDIPHELPPLVVPATVRHQLLLAWKEAMTNAMKHARATEIRVSIGAVDRNAVIRVTDNGVGIPEDADGTRDKRNGMRTMCTRIERVGGTCTIGPAPGRGTVVTLTVPSGNR